MNRTIASVLALAAMIGLVVTLGCRKSAEQSDPEPAIDVPAEDLKALVDGNNEFAIDLYKKVAEKQQGNIILSPYSISSALAMTYAGARGQTAEEMKKVLHFTLPPEKLHPAFGGLTDSLQTAGKKRSYQLNIANALWAQRGLNFVPEFREVTGKSYGASVREVDFGQSEAARGTINKWVEEQTQDKIKGLLSREDINNSVCLVLTNAIYYKGEWEQQFDKQRTCDGDFETAPGTKVKVRMMRHKDGKDKKFRTSLTGDWEFLELPYQGDRLTMVFMLPTKRCGLRGAEAKLTQAEISRGVNMLQEKEIDVWLPKFRFASRSILNEPLINLGMPSAFDNADFTGITSGGLRISKVIHGGFVEVDEEGTVAAAATHVIMQVSARHAFVADHPFLFLVRDTKSGAILFIGRVGLPK